MNFEDTLKKYLSDDEIKRLLDSFNLEQTHCLLLDTAKMSIDDFLARFPNVTKHPLIDNAFLYKKEEYDFGKLALYDLGVYSIQDASSMLDVYFLKPESTDKVLDLCAAPGGKTIGCAIAMKGQGLIVSNDLSYERSKALSSNIERMGFGNIVVTNNDFSSIYQSFAGFFDKIILDAPCSGSAMFRKNEEAKQLWSYKKVEQCAAIQKDLLQIAWRMLKPGGKIVYSTCSFSSEENEDVIIEFLSKNNDAKIIKLDDTGGLFSSSLLPESIHALPYLFPGEGQFVCLLEKENSSIIESKISSSKSVSNDLIKKFVLNDRFNTYINNSLYSLDSYFPANKLKVIRYGVKVCEKENQATPDFALARFYKGKECIEITKENAIKYLHGDTFTLDKPNGFYVVSYNNLSLGFVKVVNKLAKNFYPKGLRRLYKDI